MGVSSLGVAFYSSILASSCTLFCESCPGTAGSRGSSLGFEGLSLGLKKDVREFWAIVGVALAEFLPFVALAMFDLEWDSWDAFGASFELVLVSEWVS